jgi:hypothetical protein
VVEPTRAGLAPEALRQFMRAVGEAFEQVRARRPATGRAAPPRHPIPTPKEK